jgi:DNA-directed RNA polymerase subunit beta'
VINVKDGGEVKAGQTVANWDPHNHPIVSEVAGFMRFIDFVDGVTVIEKTDELTGLASASRSPIRSVAARRQGPAPDGPHRRQERQGPDHPGYRPAGAVPAAAALDRQPADGAEVGVGDVVAKIPQEASKTRDITGGLPRVADLFEARKPKDRRSWPSVSGMVSFGKDTKGKQRLIIKPLDGEASTKS